MRREGFTLIETLIALVVAGIAIALAAGVYASAADTLQAMRRRADFAEREALGLLWLKEALLGAAVSTEPDGRFIGEPRRMTLRTTLWTPKGWPESVVVSTTVEGGRLVMRAGEQVYILSDSLVSISFDYLSDYGAGSAWLQSLESATGAPLAVRLRRQRAGGPADTTLLYVGHGP
jgi:prepilin-type N-terminal cleavage/methylation domain-containing protein